MAKKPLKPLEDPPTASSSDDDEVETSAGEEEDDSSSSEEESKLPSSAVTIAVPGKTAVSATKQGSDSESGSETETDSDSETERPPPNTGSGKAVTVTAASSAAKAKKEKSQPSAALALPAVKSGTKRPSEGTSGEKTNATRAKKVSLGEEEKKMGEDTKKPAFQRLWSEEDEIAVLQGMIDFKADTGKSLYEDSNGFYESIKKSISFEVSKNQFMDKIRSLKKKYMGKGKNGVEPSFSKAHDQKSFELSKFIWGSEGMALESAVKSSGFSKKTNKKLHSVKQELFSANGKKVEDDKKVLVHGGESESSVDWFENSFLVRSIVGFGVDEHYVKQRWSLVPVETKKKIQEKLKVLQAKELEFVMVKTNFVNEAVSMINEES